MAIPHWKVEHCLKLDATVVVREALDVRYDVYAGRMGDAWFTYHVTPRADGTYALDLWGHHPRSAHKGHVLLTPTTPFYGGRRWWFECPRCGCRCRTVYVPPHWGRVGCRRCSELRYRSQSVSVQTRAVWRIEALKYTLGARGRATAVLAPTPPRPKGMHWKTYVRMLDTIHAATERVLQQLKGG